MSSSLHRKILGRLAIAAASIAAFSVSAAAAEKTLTVYTYESFITEWGPGAKVAEAFEKTCDCKVDYVGVADGVELLTRLKLEGQGSKADIVLGLDTNLVAEAKATGFFAPHGADTASVKVPGGFSDDTFIPYDYGHFAVVYDTEALKDPPKSLKELVEGDPSQKIVIEDPRTSTPGLGLLLWVKSVYGDKAGEAWAKLKDRVLTVTPGWSEAYGLFTKGEAPMVLSYTTSPAYHMVAENTERYQAAPFAEGHYIQIEVAALTKNAKDPELARNFLTFMIGPEFQSIIPTTNWMMPVTATKEPLPEAFGKLVDPQKTFLIPSGEVAASRKAWIDEWLAAMSRN
ncbi:MULTISPECIES: thiamine ABC transporter substrate binding subunit [Sinorhizobium]|uniref:Thiamine-binding periplasmic protein n=5 Tax=Sinorhizobium TaxID=28105 RepID=Q92L33_RHIME|nr:MULTISPECIES: thiamine ABC transporter substrate binding subunit [Sinorhizobium]PST18428.1 thiamine ABC transporter substrate binding subunit [Mesorhizobium loti]TWA89683.1 thiamine transport system substrate-binding protein [Ensifer sp. SEMIA 134]TWB26101.1 thiamine transport system substrate-binding protein [Ensifer sp. SEMIA 135]AEG05921.1 thiamine ABC transporter, periplasmic binding protein [Sinorhizobium meliloti BL225C]AEG54956.1 thiamine ABC transporter, periplasmic binding protein 